MTTRAWLVPLGLFLLALGVRLLVIPLVAFNPTEGSQYYVGVAANLVGGHGLVSDAVWSYATPPQVVPKPAFELWLPMATFVAALPMALLGSTLAAAQVGMALLGAAVAPLVWFAGREAAAVSGLDARRTRAVAITSGLVAAVLAPFVTAVAGPDSTTPFLVFGTLAAVVGPRALPSRTAAGGRPWLPPLGFGVALGLAYLSRQEAIWIAAAWLVLLAVDLRRSRPGRVLRGGVGALWPVVLGGLLVVVPWLIRNVIDLGSPLPGQAIENLWLRRNEDIFAWLDRPTASGYLGRGIGAIVGDRFDALLHQLVSVIVTPAFPVGLLGLVAVVALWRSPALRGPTALALLLLSGGLTFLATALLFPVATRWGTFLHAAGPLLVGLIVATALAGDALMARVSVRRAWGQVNVVLVPIALLAVTLPLLGLQLLIVSRQADALGARFAATAIHLASLTGSSAGAGAGTDAAGARPVYLTDHPMWLADATGDRAIALPDEPLTSVADLARTFGVTWIVVFDEDGRYPAALLTPEAARCLAEAPRPIGPADDPVVLARIAPECTAP
jgi:hypothetical protein